MKKAYRYRTTVVDTVDFGDGTSAGAWLAGECRGVRLGVYVDGDGELSFTDHMGWRIENDFETAGIDPASKKAESIMASWVCAVKFLWQKIMKERVTK